MVRPKKNKNTMTNLPEIILLNKRQKRILAEQSKKLCKSKNAIVRELIDSLEIKGE